MPYDCSDFNKKNEGLLVKIIKKWKKKNKKDKAKIKILKNIRNFCDSPIERIILYELWILYYRKDKELKICNNDNKGYKAKLFYTCPKSEHEIQIFLQYDITAKKEDYRTDFFITVLKNGRKNSLIIEADGYPYHSEREAMKKDRKRDRDILYKYKYNTIRYLGTEIYNKSKKVAKDISKHISLLQAEL